MINIKHLIHQECARHDVSSIVVETLIARILVSRAIYNRTWAEPTWTILVGWRRHWRWDQRLIDAAIDMITDIELKPTKVLVYVREYIRVHCSQAWNDYSIKLSN